MEYFELSIKSNSSGHDVTLAVKPNLRKVVKKYIVKKSTGIEFDVSLGKDVVKTLHRKLAKRQVKDVIFNGGDILFCDDIVKTGKVKLFFVGRKALSSFVKRTAKSAKNLERIYLVR